ncbi:glycerol-3-phosphate dehydrogenase (NAD(P)+) [Propionibacterium cyclohexanicum]|uniref:Glycerol-3-phosphate dehydrogenase n=1 Tax=Propionibacterium cyclohexanicum TaxID=64702 RepID=A0A1H9R5V6_9ACTN|nr:glycerol-3-phosphate dehydrogenase [Propionibacterium cyclohexanicum]SER68112.1 glycerol-3-phosphate dehydrogenase (NAD(P)+) [Propionibacterium cyclohexanicum]
MATVTILGAGAMGAAQCRPLADAGWDVRLWGTRFDDELLDLLSTGAPHPRTGVPLPDSVHIYRSGQLGEALADSRVVVMAVISAQVPRLAREILEPLANADSLWLTSKGFSQVEDGRVRLLSENLRRIAQEAHVELPPIVTVAGPVLADECAAARPTAPVFACHDISVAQRYARQCSTPAYSIMASGDEVGVEVCAPLKNSYAMALGLVDGLSERDGAATHNLRAATFVQAVHEMAVFGRQLGGDPMTAAGLAGLGDLEVTGQAGRNHGFGRRIGLGASTTQAREEMAALGQSVEGIDSTRLALLFADQIGHGLLDHLPLLRMVGDVLLGREIDPLASLAKAVLPRTS